MNLILLALFFAQLVSADPKAVGKVSAPKPDPQINCYLNLSPGAYEENKVCEGHNVTVCSKNPKVCRWVAKQFKCRGQMYSFCTGLLPHACNEGVEVVTAFPVKLAAKAKRFTCSEKSPITIKELK